MAFAAIANVAVIVVLFTIVALVTVMPLPPPIVTKGFEPCSKFVPVIVTVVIVVPSAPAEGLIIVIVGGGAFTVNCTTLDVVAPSVVTKTVCAPRVAVPEMVNVAVMVVGLVTVGLLAVMPEPLKEIEAGEKKFVPVSVIVPVVVPTLPLLGLIMVSVGAPFTVN